LFFWEDYFHRLGQQTNGWGEALLFSEKSVAVFGIVNYQLTFSYILRLGAFIFFG
jgi:hypothetical protein